MADSTQTKTVTLIIKATAEGLDEAKAKLSASGVAFTEVTKTVNAHADSLTALAKKYDPVFRADQQLIDGQAKVRAAYDAYVQKGGDVARANDLLARSLVGVQQQHDATITRLNTHTTGVSSFGEAIGKVNTLLGAFGIALGLASLVQFGKHVIESVGGLVDMAETMGLTVKSLQVYQYAALQSGVSTEQLQTGLARFSRTIGEAADHNDKAISSFDKLKVGILDSNGAVRSTDAILQDVAKAITAIQEPTARSRTEFELFGRGGQTLAAFLKEVATSADGMADRAKAAGVIVNDDLAEKFKEGADKAKIFGMQVTVVAANLIELIATMGKYMAKEQELANQRSGYPSALSGDMMRGIINPKFFQPGAPLVVGPSNSASGSISDLNSLPTGWGAPGPNSNPQSDADKKKQDDAEKYLQTLKDQAAAAAMTADQQKIVSALRELDAKGGDKVTQAMRDQVVELVKLRDLNETESTLRLKQFQDDLKSKQELEDKQALVERDISNMETLATVHVATSEELHIQQAILTEQNKLYDAQGKKLDDLKAKDIERITNATKLKDANEKFQKDVEATSKRVLNNISQAAGDILFDYLDGKAGNFWDTFEKLGKRAFANLVADSLTQTFLKGPINSIVSSLPGLFGINVPGSTASGGASGGTGGLGILNYLPNPTSFSNAGSTFTNIGRSLGFFGGSLDASGSAGANMLNASLIEEGGSASIGSSGVASGLSGALGAIPVWGWIAMAATIAKQFVAGSSPGSAGGVIDTLLLPSLDQWMTNPGRSTANVVDPIGLALSDVLGGKGSVASWLTPGGLLNNLLGSNPSVGPNGTTSIASYDALAAYGQQNNYGAVAPGRLITTITGADNGADPNVTLQAAQATVTALNALADKFNLYFGAQTDAGTFIGQGAAAAGPHSGAELLDQLLGRGAVTSSDPHIQAAINSSTSATLETNLGLVSTMVDLLKNVNDNGSIDPKPLTQTEQALKAINDAFDQMKGKATDFAYSLDDVETARQKAIAQVTTGFNDSITAQILAFTDPLQQAMDALAKAQDQRLTEAKAAGADLVQVEKLSGLERARALSQFMQPVTAANDNIANYVHGLSFGANSALSPQSQLALAGSQFDVQSQLALGGDFKARQGITGYADTYLNAQRALTGSGVDTAAVFGRITDVLMQLVSQDPMQELQQAGLAATKDQTQVIQDTQAAIVTELKAIKSELTQIKSAPWQSYNVNGTSFAA